MIDQIFLAIVVAIGLLAASIGVIAVLNDKRTWVRAEGSACILVGTLCVIAANMDGVKTMMA